MHRISLDEYGSLIKLTSPSVDCKCSSFLQVAFKSPAAAVTCIPFGASIIKDLVGDSSLENGGGLGGGDVNEESEGIY